MNIIQGFLLGIIQGFTVFLPLSSEGHITLSLSILGIEKIDAPYKFFITLTSFLTLILFFRNEIGDLTKSYIRILKRKDDRTIKEDVTNLNVLMYDDEKSFKTITSIHISVLFTFIVGYLIRRFVTIWSIKFIGLGFIISGFMLIFAMFKLNNPTYVQKANDTKRLSNGVSKWVAIVIGVMNGLGNFFGISHVASSFFGGIVCNINKYTTSIYSFLLYIPLIFLSLLFQTGDMIHFNGTVNNLAIFVSNTTALIIGYGSLTLFFRIMKSDKLHYFSYYLIPIGIITLLFI